MLPLLNVQDLNIVFSSESGEVKAVNGINFSVQAGETIGIVGESGSGKSVTALALMNLLGTTPAQVSGLAHFQNKQGEQVDLFQLPKQALPTYRGSEIAMIFQEPMTSLNPVFRCGKQITEAIQAHRSTTLQEAKDETLALFQKVQLPDPQRIFDAYPHQLSGGQKQRVMIAMAMSCQPRLLLADEPTTALDVTVQKAILNLMNELKTESGMSMIFISHDLGVIAEIADRVLVMFKGKIVEQGRVAAIFKNPQHPYTKSLLACRPPLGKKLKRLPVANDFLTVVEQNDGTYEAEEKPKSMQQILEAVTWTAPQIEAKKAALIAKENILKVQALKTWFPAKRNFFGQVQSFVKAVDDVSFEVVKGEVLGLVGESGCGKTTLGRTILQLIPATSGVVIFDNQDFLTLEKTALRNLRKDLQIIFQDPYASLNPRMTIGAAIMEPMKTHRLFDNSKTRREKAIDLLETVELDVRSFNRYPSEFSGGQRQRICIARALATQPKFLICDECVSALDVSVQATILNLLMDLREKHQLSYIFISHDLSVVQFMSDRMIVMKAGKIEEMGWADAIYNNPQKAYTQRLIEAIPKGM